MPRYEPTFDPDFEPVYNDHEPLHSTFVESDTQRLRSNLYPLPGGGWDAPDQWDSAPSAMDSVYEAPYGTSDVYTEGASDDSGDAVLPGSEPRWNLSPGPSTHQSTSRGSLGRGTLRSPIASLGYRSQGKLSNPSHHASSAPRSSQAGSGALSSGQRNYSHSSQHRSNPPSHRSSYRSTYGVASQIPSHSQSSLSSQHLSEPVVPSPSPSPPSSEHQSPRAYLPTSTWRSYRDSHHSHPSSATPGYGAGINCLDANSQAADELAGSVGPDLSASIGPMGTPGPLRTGLDKPWNLTVASLLDTTELALQRGAHAVTGRSRGLTMSSYASGASTTKAPSDQTRQPVYV